MQTIALPGTFDGLLLFAAHEVLTSPEALDHLLALIAAHRRCLMPTGGQSFEHACPPQPLVRRR